MARDGIVVQVGTAILLRMNTDVDAEAVVESV